MATYLDSALEVAADVAGLSADQREAARTDVQRLVRSLLTVSSARVAIMLDVSEDTVSSWCRKGEFRDAFSLGKAGWRISLDSLQAFRDARRVAPAEADAEPATRGRWRPPADVPEFDESRFMAYKGRR